MDLPLRKKIVVLGMMAHMPVAGNVWLVLHYLLGFRRLGYESYYVEAHGITPSKLMRHCEDDASQRAADFIDRMLRRFDLGGCWAFHARHDDGCCYGMTGQQLGDLYRSADLIINLHGGTLPLPEHSHTGRLIYLETDPVQREVELFNDEAGAAEFLEPHRAFFSWGENYGNPDCKVPMDERFSFRPTRAPVLCDLWQNGRECGGEAFTTIGNWRQSRRPLQLSGEIYTWSKHHEFLKFLDLPSRVRQPFELALGGCTDADRQMLLERDWRVRPAAEFSSELDPYRFYIQESRGEFTVAKDQNVRLRSGWFSERSAQYLAAGRPVITQETGFSNALPTGRGLFAFSEMDDILAAIDSINSDYEGHCRAARDIAREYFNYDVVLKRLLDDAGLEPASARSIFCGDAT